MSKKKKKQKKSQSNQQNSQLNNQKNNQQNNQQESSQKKSPKTQQKKSQKRPVKKQGVMGYLSSLPSVQLLTKKDWICMLTLTLIFTILVFYRLGNTYAPESYYETTSEERDIILDFGDYITVEQLDIYLGNLENRQLSLSAYNEVTKEWENISDETVTSVFQWNRVNVYYTLRYLGIVCTSEDGGVFNEIVCLGKDGEILLPVNSDEYPGLFDEQEMYYDSSESTYMEGTMFDEIYHARTGYEFVHGLPTYETTHPQLGKCLIALGIKMFGMTPFGFRFFVALFGLLFVPLMYCFAKLLFNETYVATATALLFTFDCMHYTLSRISTIDIFVAFFIIQAYYYMFYYMKAFNAEYKGKNHITGELLPRRITGLLALSGLTMGFAIATKLTGVYAAVGLAIIFLVHTFTHYPAKKVKKLALFCITFFIVIPLITYTLAYIPAVEAYAQMGYTDKTITWNENGLYIGYGWTGLIARTLRNTNYMINYHAHLEATHPYMSDFYTWPVVYKPLLAANALVSQTEEITIRSTVNYIGNVAVWWAAIPCVLFVLYKAIRKEKTAILLTVSYLAQYIPWMGVSRCVFIYHYFPSFIFSVLMIGYTINALITWKPKLKKVVNVYLAAVIVIFLLFFPLISGVPFSYEWTHKLNWFKSWTLI
ncbi:MAG: phospholipid carrier-dependent glycosyltransferase [Eubacterium sp.]|nr:phospholipid carrier-dependent glycosyltransferase [Eubacterium sp.]